MTQVRRASDNSLIAAYTYNYNGLRKSKTVNGVTTNFHWDAFGNLVRESDTNGNTLALYYYDSGGNLVGLKKNSQYYIYHKNLRGDIVTVTQYNKAIQAQYSYDSWGTQTSYTGTLAQPFSYAGYYCDAETGLYYLKSRYYNPTLGRFLTKDGYGFIKHENPQTLNLYVYCGNNPVNRRDPNGNADVLVRDYIESRGGTVDWDPATSFVTITLGDVTRTYYGREYVQSDSRMHMDDSQLNSTFCSSSSGGQLNGAHTAGYGDINVTAISQWGIGGTSGVMTDNTGNHTYGGVALGLPGYSTSGTGSTKYTVSKGLNGAIQVQAFGYAFQGGLSSSGWFWEAGGGAGTTPASASVVIYYVK